MIRDAVADDAEALVEMGRAYFDETGIASQIVGLEFCPQSFLLSCEAMSSQGVMLVAEVGGEVVGMLGAAIGPILWNLQVPVARGCWWYVKPERRSDIPSKLIQAFERKVASRGVVLCAMVEELGPRKGISRLYEAKGYAPAESVFLKRIAGAPNVH